MGKIELHHLLEFLSQYHRLANWFSFIKFLPILDVEAGLRRAIEVPRGGPGSAEEPHPPEWGRRSEEAVGGGGLWALAGSPACQAEHTQPGTQSCIKSEIFGRHLALGRSWEPRGRWVEDIHQVAHGEGLATHHRVSAIWQWVSGPASGAGILAGLQILFWDIFSS